MVTNNTFSTLQTARILCQRIIGTRLCVCVYSLCNDSEMRPTTQSAMLRHACSQQYGNTIEYMYQTRSKSIFCFVLVNFNLCNNAMKSPITQIFVNEDIKKHGITSNISLTNCSIFFINIQLLLSLSIFFLMTGNCPPPLHPPGYGHVLQAAGAAHILYLLIRRRQRVVPRPS